VLYTKESGTRIYNTELGYTGTLTHSLTHSYSFTHSLTYALRYSNNDVYEGSLLRGKRVGHGKLLVSNGDKYIGNFMNDCMHGEGLLVTQHSTYEGNFAENKYHGTALTHSLTHSLTHQHTHSLMQVKAKSPIITVMSTLVPLFILRSMVLGCIKPMKSLWL
jgi:hypothetical protein